MKRFPAAVALCGVAVLIGVTGCEALRGEPVQADVVIAADLELTGPGAALGKTYKRALELKVEQVNQQGLLGGRKLSLEIRDNRTESRTSVQNVAEMSADTAVTAIVTGACAECTLAVVRTVNEAKVPTVSLAVPTAVTSPVDQRRYVFKVAPNPVDSAAALAGEMARGNVKKVAIAATDDRYGQDGLTTMRGEIEKAGLKVTGGHTFPPGEQELGPVARRILQDQPDAVVVLAFAPLANQVGKSLRDNRYTGRLFFDAAAADDLFLTGPSATAVDGATMVFTPTLVSDDVIATSPAKAERRAWFRDYTSRYGTYAAFASFAADAVQLVVEAVNRTGGTDREALRNAMETTQLDGLSGPIRITPDNHSGLMPQALTVLVASSGRWRLAS